jgi:hypothetical protein
VTQVIKWRAAPEEDNYPAAQSYLSLIYNPTTTAQLVKKLRAAPLTSFKSKDIFRASRLPLLGVSSSQMARDQKKIRKGRKLSPILLVRDEPHGKVVIADGYHRLCAVYTFDEDAEIPCKIV